MPASLPVVPAGLQRDFAIASIRSTFVDVPTVRRRELSSLSVTAQSYVIVELRLANGTEGIGEAATLGGPRWSEESVESIKATIDAYLAPASLGAPANRFEVARIRMDAAAKRNNAAKGAIESATFDAVGKTLGVPAVQLLGGAVRESVPVLWTLASGDPAQEIEEAEEKLAGRLHDTFKVKIGARSPEADVMRLRRLADALAGQCRGARTVIDDQTPFIPLVVPRASGELTELEAKQVKIGARRYIVCRNLAEARRDAEQREAILGGLRAKLAQGDKALLGNSGFRRYLKTVSAEHFAIDEARVADDARFDGLYVLRINSKIAALQVMLRYRDLLRVEQLLRQANAVLTTRPIYHSSDMAIRGHVFCSFLALLLVKELEDRLRRHGIAAEWGDILRDLDRLQEIQLDQDGKRFLLRTPTTGVAGKLFQAVGVALPPNIQEIPLPNPQPAV